MKEEIMADMKTYTVCLTSRTDVNQEKADVWLEEMKAWQKETSACQEATEAYLERKEPTPVEMANVPTHAEVPNEEVKLSLCLTN
jgi:hypothetical protein